VLEREGACEALLRGAEDVDAARVQRLEPRASAEDVELRALLRARLGEYERALRKIERREADLLRNGRAALLPAEPARDHEVDREEEIALERQDDALPEALDPEDALPLGLGELRLERAEEERAHQAHALERLAGDARRQRLHVDGDVGELRHREG